MSSTDQQLWLDGIRGTVGSYRNMIDATVDQLTDEEFFQRPTPEINSVAIVLRHLGGNLQSRWTDFLTTDGEKPDRDRDSEFAEWQGDRKELVEYFDQGWSKLRQAIEQIDDQNLHQSILIRGEAHSIPQALTRSITHVSYHVGQIAMIARMVHQGPWRWLTVQPGMSGEHNRKTWGTSKSRSIFGEDPSDQS